MGHQFLDFINSEALAGAGYTEFTPFTGVEVGFTVKRQSKDDIRNNKASILNVYLPRKTLMDSTTKKEIRATVQWGEDIPGQGIRLDLKQKIWATDPVPLVSEQEYFFDTKEKSILKKTQPITQTGLLDELYSLHTKSTRLSGIWLRVKILVVNFFLPGVIFFCAKNLKRFLKLGFDIKYQENDLKEIILNNGKRISPDAEALKKAEKIFTENDTLEFYGFRISQRAVFGYSLLCLLGFFSFGFLEKNFPVLESLRRHSGNSFFTLAFIIVSLSTYDKLIPWFARKLINRMIDWAYNLKIRTFKI